MKNLLEKALGRAGPPIPEHLQEHIELSPDDKELADIVEGLTLSIKVIGCGGGGSNTVSRLMEEGAVDERGPVVDQPQLPRADHVSRLGK